MAAGFLKIRRDRSRAGTGSPTQHPLIRDNEIMKWATVRSSRGMPVNRTNHVTPAILALSRRTRDVATVLMRFLSRIRHVASVALLP